MARCNEQTASFRLSSRDFSDLCYIAEARGVSRSELCREIILDELFVLERCVLDRGHALCVAGILRAFFNASDSERIAILQHMCLNVQVHRKQNAQGI